MKFTKTKRDIVEAIKAKSKRRIKEEKELTVIAVAPEAHVDALKKSEERKAYIAKIMKEAEKNRDEIIKLTGAKKLAEEFVEKTFKDRAVVTEDVLSIDKLTREELISLMEHARANKIKYAINKVNEIYDFKYLFSKPLKEELSYEVIQYEMNDEQRKELFKLHNCKEPESMDDFWNWAEEFYSLNESKNLKEDVEGFWTIVSKKVGGAEEVERYEDFDDARADFKYIVEEEPDGFEYAVLQKVTVEDGIEEIEILGEFREGELVEAKNLEEAKTSKGNQIAKAIMRILEEKDLDEAVYVESNVITEMGFNNTDFIF